MLQGAEGGEVYAEGEEGDEEYEEYEVCAALATRSYHMSPRPEFSTAMWVDNYLPPNSGVFFFGLSSI
jgi:hypothetical protein